MKVLLAEDSLTVMLTTSAIIKKSGHQVIQARDGKQALELYTSEEPDLVLLDVEMPEFNGFEVAEKIRAMNNEIWVPIIFLTGFADDENLSRAIDAGGDDYLTKPVSDIVLNAKLNAMHRISEMQNRLRSVSDQLTEMNNKLQQSVITDPLTGAHNRLYMDECIEREWYRAMRTKTELSILLTDVDNFKALNDSNGHCAGDTCLKEIVSLIDTHLKRSTDVLCRYGGDEFVVILPDTCSTYAMEIGEKIRQSVEHYSTQLELNTAVDISVSIGCAACVPNTDINYNDYLKLADKALYVAKETGRNRVHNLAASDKNNIAA